MSCSRPAGFNGGRDLRAIKKQVYEHPMLTEGGGPPHFLQTGLKEYGWLGRHINPEVCAVGAIFHWLAWRFHVMKEPVPNFTDPESLWVASCNLSNQCPVPAWPGLASHLPVQLA